MKTIALVSLFELPWIFKALPLASAAPPRWTLRAATGPSPLAARVAVPSGERA